MSLNHHSGLIGGLAYNGTNLILALLLNVMLPKLERTTYACREAFDG
jgi:hypothetical protein